MGLCILFVYVIRSNYTRRLQLFPLHFIVGILNLAVCRTQPNVGLMLCLAYTQAYVRLVMKIGLGVLSLAALYTTSNNTNVKQILVILIAVQSVAVIVKCNNASPSISLVGLEPCDILYFYSGCQVPDVQLNYRLSTTTRSSLCLIWFGSA